jgi:hypothetical protein
VSEDQRCIEFPPYGAPYLDAVARDPAALQVSIILSYLGSVLFVIGLLGLVHFVRGRGVLAHVAGAIAVFGYIGLTALFWTGVYDLAIAQHAARSLGVRIWDAPESYFSAYVLLIPALLGTALGTVLLAVAAWRAGLAPLWVWPVVVIGFVILIVEPFGTTASGLILAVSLLAAFGFLGVQLLRMTAADWERGVGRGSASESAP